MDIVLGVSMEPSAVRMVLIEGSNADGVDSRGRNIEAAPPLDEAVTRRLVHRSVIAALIGTREGAVEGGYQLTSTGVTWTDPAEVAALRLELAARDVGSVMLVSPLLAAAALAQTVGSALDYEHIAMLFVEADSATLAVVDVADGSIVDLHRQSLPALEVLSARKAPWRPSWRRWSPVWMHRGRGPMACSSSAVGSTSSRSSRCWRRRHRLW